MNTLYRLMLRPDNICLSVQQCSYVVPVHSARRDLFLARRNIAEKSDSCNKYFRGCWYCYVFEHWLQKADFSALSYSRRWRALLRVYMCIDVLAGCCWAEWVTWLSSLWSISVGPPVPLTPCPSPPPSSPFYQPFKIHTLWRHNILYPYIYNSSAGNSDRMSPMPYCFSYVVRFLMKKMETRSFRCC